MAEFFDNALYESVESALSLMNCDVDPAECHGMLCGMLCGMHQFDASAWLGHTTGYQDEISWSDLGSGHALMQLLDETLSGFSADDFSLQVLLPPDDSPLELRASALGSWCRGFLSGFGLGDSVNIDLLSDDSQGFLRDLHEIGRVDPLEAEDNGDEFAFVEICEYARIGTLLLREEHLAASVNDEGKGTIH